jgi:hypothetical protein
MNKPDVNELIGDALSNMTGKKPDAAPVVKVEDPPAPVVKKDDTAPVVKTDVTPPAALFGKPAKKPDEKSDDHADPSLPSDAQIATWPQHGQKAVREMRERIKNLNAELAQVKAKPATVDNKEEFEALKKQASDLQDIVDRVALEQSPRFKLKYATPKQTIMNQVKAQLKAFEVDEAIAEQAAALPPKERLALLKQHAEDLAPALFNSLGRLDELEAERTAEIEKSAEARRQDQVAMQ